MWPKCSSTITASRTTRRSTSRAGAAAHRADRQEYRVLTWNIGFGAYEDDSWPFMDGGTESWAWSEDRLKANLAEISNVLLNEAADIYFLQEVDFDSTRTYHVDERPYLYQAQPDFCKLHAVNYDSPFLLYPLTQPHGASRSCLLTMAGLHVTSAVRRSSARGDGVHEAARPRPVLPVARVPVENGHELVLYDLHLSAYSSDGTIADEQPELLLADMQAEYEAGNYVGRRRFQQGSAAGGEHADLPAITIWALADPHRSLSRRQTSGSLRRSIRRLRWLLAEMPMGRMQKRAAAADGGRVPRVAECRGCGKRGHRSGLCEFRIITRAHDVPFDGRRIKGTGGHFLSARFCALEDSYKIYGIAAPV